MMRDIYSMKEYIRKELEEIEDFGTLHDIFCSVIRKKGLTYQAIRRARIREAASQMKIDFPRTR